MLCSYTLIKGISLILVLLNVSLLVTIIPKRAINVFILLVNTMSIWMFNFVKGSLIFSRNVSLVPLQVEISGKEEDMLWLKEKRLWISSQGEDSIDLRKGESFDTPNPVATEFASEKRRDGRPTRLFQ